MMRFSKKKLLAACIPVLPAFAAVLPASEGLLGKVAPREERQLLDFGSFYKVPLFAIFRQLLTLS